MSSSAPPQTTTIPSIISIPISEKLTKTNYLLWRAQVLSAVHAAQLEGLIAGTEKAPDQYDNDKTVSKEINPAYNAWVVWDQAVLRYVLSSLT
jgi:hypothetical protein